MPSLNVNTAPLCPMIGGEKLAHCVPTFYMPRERLAG